MTMTEAAYRNDIVKTGLNQVGKLYRDSAVPTHWPNDQFDCSTFTHWLEAKHGVNIDKGKLETLPWPPTEPRPWHKYPGYTMNQQVTASRLAGTIVPFSQIKPGDRLYYDKPGQHHVVVYIGDGKVVHAAGTAYGVIVSPLVRPGEVGHGGKKLTMCVSATKFARACGYVFAKPPVAPSPKPPAEALRVDLSLIKRAAKLDPNRQQGNVTAGAKDDVLLVERALVDFGYLQNKWVDGSFGTMTREAYAKWQRHLGYSGKDANGIPGERSLKKLGKAPSTKRKFRVIP